MRSRPAAVTRAAADKFVTAHCVSCHAATKPKGDFSVAPLAGTKPVADRLADWRNVLERLEARDMPPEGGKAGRPSEAEFAAVTEWLEKEIRKADGLTAG